MTTTILLLAIATSIQAQTFVPVHGCEWVPETTSVANFTFVESATNTSTSNSVQWQIPAFGISCSKSSSTSAGSTISIDSPGTITYVTCKATSSDPTTGTFVISAAGGAANNVTLTNVAYAQCAADIYAFHYRADFALLCETDLKGSKTCVAKGNSTASVIGEQYLPPIRPGPPPPRGMQ